jgi:hypothetical protein
MYRYVGVFVVGGLMCVANSAQSEPVTLFPHIGVDASLPFQYSNNALNSANDRRGDGALSPLLKLSAGQLKPADGVIGYSIYSIVTSDIYSRVKDAQGALATFGGSVTFVSGKFVYGGIFENSYLYDGVFKQRVLTVEDFTGFVAYVYKNKPAGLFIKTSFAPSYRFADDQSAQRAVYTLKADIKQLLVGNYYFVATPKLKFYQFTNDINAGRRDWLPSITGGIEYDFNDSVSLTTAVGYETRKSNFDGKNYNAFTIGISLDFSTTFDR